MTAERLLAAEAVPGEWEWLGNAKEAINGGFDPISSAVQDVVFYSVPIGNGLPLIVVWLVVAAIIFTIYFRAPQLTSWKTSYDLVRGKYSRASDPGEITHFAALSSAVSGTVGLGNIAGVGAAMVLGGPGATFWMILAGLLGMCTKFVECTLGVKYREVHEDGSITGGPFRYLPVAYDRLGGMISKNPSNGLRTVGRISNKVAVGIFAIALFFFGAIGGNMFQANQTFAQAKEVTGGDEGFLGSSGASLVFGVVLALLVGAVIIGGVTSIAKVTSRLVPVMGLIYVGACLIVLLVNYDGIPTAFSRIFTEAFTPAAGLGGFIGVLIVGFQRAAFSNEAGVGSAPIVHSAVKTKHPVSEGYVALLEPFIDTVVVCTMTALAIVVTDTTFYQEAQQTSIDGGGTADGVVVTSRAFGTVLEAFPVVLAIAVALFAFSTLITWSYYTLKAWTQIFGRSPLSENIFKLLFCVFTVIGSVVTFDSVLGFADAMLFVCSIFNLLACYLLLPVVREEMRTFREGRRTGEITIVPVEERATT